MFISMINLCMNGGLAAIFFHIMRMMPDKPLQQRSLQAKAALSYLLAFPSHLPLW